MTNETTGYAFARAKAYDQGLAAGREEMRKAVLEVLVAEKLRHLTLRKQITRAGDWDRADMMRWAIDEAILKVEKIS